MKEIILILVLVVACGCAVNRLIMRRPGESIWHTKKHLLFMCLGLFLFGCGTVRYQIKSPTDSRHGVQTEVQWDVVTLHFNDLWGKIIPGWR